MKKVGIITHYYLSDNYGGNLQAYALAEFINRLDGYCAEQICFDFLNKNKVDSKKTKKNEIISAFVINRPLYSIRTFLYICKKRVRKSHFFKEQKNKAINRIWKKRFAIRTNATRIFNQTIIPHSKCVYDEKNISECNREYDIFITGSDQVWAGCSNAFTLGFVNQKPKISYAASLGRSTIPDKNREFLKNQLKDYTAISVRSKDDKRIVSELSDKEVEMVSDPAFLFDKNEWNLVAAKERRYSNKYVFCYFLGDNKKQKKLAADFAKMNNLKVVNIAHFTDNTNGVIANDLLFGDYRPYDISPADFIALIRDADYVFTDSFHALVFSMIYHKQFFAFERISKYGDMNARLVSLLELVGLNQRFCNNDNCYMEYINSIEQIDYDDCDKKLQKEIQHSKEFLCNNI